MHLATTEDIPFINEVMNHPMVRPHVWYGDDLLDCTKAIELMWTLVVPGSGVMMAEALGDGNYLALVAFKPESWGAKAVSSMRLGIRKLFTETDAVRLYGSVKPTNTRACRNLRGMGMNLVQSRGNRVTGHINYIDLLDMDMFKETVRGGWAGKALYWWGIKSKIEDINPIFPMDPVKPVFTDGNGIIDLTEA